MTGLDEVMLMCMGVMMLLMDTIEEGRRYLGRGRIQARNTSSTTWRKPFGQVTAEHAWEA